MKSISIATALFLLLFAGCTSTYRVNDFSSKENFYDEFNDSFKAKEVKVTLANDSSFIAQNGVEIKNDTLFSFVNFEAKQNRQLALSDVVDIEFLGKDITSASILLKNADELKAENVRRTTDSIHFVEIKSLITSNTIAQIDKVKTVTFKNRWYGISLWAITGALTGGIIGLLNVKSFSTSHWESQELMNFPVGASVGFITGAIAGYIVGYEIHYQFNP